VAGNQLSGIFAGLTRVAQRIATDITKENWPTFFEEFKAFEHIEIEEAGPHREGEAWYPDGPRY
jgi:hypothetical protein